MVEGGVMARRVEWFMRIKPAVFGRGDARLRAWTYATQGGKGDRCIDKPPSATSSAACLGPVYAHNAGDCRATHGLTRALGDADTRRHRAIAANDRLSRRDIMGRLIR